MGQRRSWVAPVVLTAALAVATTLIAIAVNTATAVQSRWPAGLEVVRERPFLWVAGLTVMTAGLGVALWWTQRQGAPAVVAGSPASFTGDEFGLITLAPTQTGRPTVAQLPPVCADFTGRQAEVDQIIDWLTSDASPRGAGPRVVNIYGIPGSGKSTLAVWVGHRIRDRYGDCQLHFDVRGAGRPESVEDLLGGMLVMLGTPPAQVPAGLPLRTAQYRWALSGYRSFILIDNVSSAGQVEPLLPGPSDSAVIVTSWAPLPELPGVRVLQLPQLTMVDAEAMLVAVSQRTVRDADRPAVQRIARLTGCLPLALRISASLLKVRPHWSWSDLAGRLGDRDGAPRLDRMVSGDLAVEVSFDLAYHDLGEATARGYRLLGLAPAPSWRRGWRGCSSVTTPSSPTRSSTSSRFVACCSPVALARW